MHRRPTQVGQASWPVHQRPDPVRHRRYLAQHLCSELALMALTALVSSAQPSNCNAPAVSPSVTIALPSRPFAVRPSADGCQVFVSLMGDDSAKNPGIALLKRAEGRIELLRVVPLKSPPTGLALTHDGKLLIAAAGDGPVFLNVGRMASGDSNPVLGSFSDGANSQSIYANVSPGDKLLFISEERAHSITVIDLQRARSNARTATKPMPSSERFRSPTPPSRSHSLPTANGSIPPARLPCPIGTGPRPANRKAAIPRPRRSRTPRVRSWWWM